jgi:glycosyltransferase involved in cell wall biosynthesis
MKLLIAIPALNEEDSIQDIIERCLAARETICEHSPVTHVDVTVVSDGSTDQTVERAQRFSGKIRLIVFPKNQGYGAAIKAAWSESDADLLGFLDADGTCEPKFFADLCSALVKENADVALGCRLNQQSRMPVIRRIGNFMFALLLSAFSSQRVRDTASGMRVVRRSCLPRLYPLPDGLHFTPAMSARAIMSNGVRITEIDMPYHERAGESKLRVGKDGLRFLKVILQAAFLYHPSRPFGMMAIVLFLIAWSLMLQPIQHYVHSRSVAEWMIYRFLVSHLLALAACLCFCASYLTDRICCIALGDELPDLPRRRAAQLFQSERFWAVPLVLLAAGAALVFGSLLELLSTGATYEHWSRYIVMSFCFSAALMLAVTRGIDHVLSLVAERVGYLRPRPGQDVLRGAPGHGRAAIAVRGNNTERLAAHGPEAVL